jgi:hypothetical protein
MFKLVFLLVACSILVADAALADDWPADSKWMAHCAANLKGEHQKPAAVRKYCLCMAGLGDEAKALTMTEGDLESAWPPAHLQCHNQAGLKPG